MLLFNNGRPGVIGWSVIGEGYIKKKAGLKGWTPGGGQLCSKIPYASESASFITGQVLAVDGGFSPGRKGLRNLMINLGSRSLLPLSLSCGWQEYNQGPTKSGFLRLG